MAVDVIVRQVQTHLEEVHDDPSRSLDEKLLENVDAQVTEAIQEHERDVLLNQLSRLLPTLQQDPSPVTNLIQRLISPHRYEFSRVLSIQPPVDFITGLTSSISVIKITVLDLLRKAQFRTSDIGIVAGKPEIVGALVRLWLCSPDTAVATRAQDVLSEMLVAEVQSSPMGPDRNIVDECLLWRRLFRDKDIYDSMFSLCSFSTIGQDGQPSKSGKTIAQARLLDMILHIDSEPLRTSQLAEIERRYGVPQEGGLLHFAAVSMVDYKDDVLMHMTLMDFYTKYLSMELAHLQPSPRSTADLDRPHFYPLHFLQAANIHERTISYYLNPEAHDSTDLTFLYGSSANYLAVYCSTCSQDMLRHENIVESVLNRLSNVLETVSPGQWAQGQTPKHDLRVIASLPRVTLIPSRLNSPLYLLPSKSASPNTFNAMAQIFNGRDGSKSAQEHAAARVLYFLYMEIAPSFWTEVVSAAETVAMKDVALAAISLIGAIITAQWAPLEGSPSSDCSAFALPTEEKLAERCHTHGVQLPRSGIETIMSQPAIGTVVPYLMKPAQTFSNLVGGGRGDVESAAYSIAVAKHDVLILLHQKLKDWVGDHGDVREMVATVGRRIAQGSMGGSSDVGGRVGTMDL